jgi:hypothetical protein
MPADRGKINDKNLSAGGGRKLNFDPFGKKNFKIVIIRRK